MLVLTTVQSNPFVLFTTNWYTLATAPGALAIEQYIQFHPKGKDIDDINEEKGEIFRK